MDLEKQHKPKIARCKTCSSLIDRTSTCSEGRIALQRLVKYLDPKDILTQYAVKQGCVRLRDALKCISDASFIVMLRRA